VELLFTYDEEFGGEVGPAWLLQHKIIKPDLMVAAGFSYQVVTAHNGCLQMEVTVHGKMAHAAIPSTGVDALQAANHILTALYAQNTLYKNITSKVEGITHPYLNIGTIEGGTNTNVVPGRVRFKLDRRMIPEENPTEVEATLRQLIQTRPRACPASRWTSNACCWHGPCNPCPATVRWWTRSRNMESKCSENPSPLSVRPCTPTCGCFVKPAFLA
jgi:acetylornithine deacetylase/succinyl-diaminopimelate desuccinylase-like protein